MQSRQSGSLALHCLARETLSSILSFSTYCIEGAPLYENTVCSGCFFNHEKEGDPIHCWSHSQSLGFNVLDFGDMSSCSLPLRLFSPASTLWYFQRKHFLLILCHYYLCPLLWSHLHPWIGHIHLPNERHKMNVHTYFKLSRQSTLMIDSKESSAIRWGEEKKRKITQPVCFEEIDHEIGVRLPVLHSYGWDGTNRRIRNCKRHDWKHLAFVPHHSLRLYILILRGSLFNSTLETFNLE